MNAELIRECNELIRAGFHEVDDSWRRFAVIRPAQDFGHAALQTYAKMVELSPSQIESGEYRGILRKFGRQAALKFNDVFWRELGEAGGPKGFDSVIANLPRGIDEMMEGLFPEVTFLLGQQYPVVEHFVKGEEETLILRGYYDFGVTVKQAETTLD